MEGISCSNGNETLRRASDVPDPYELTGVKGYDAPYWYGIGLPPQDVRQGWKLYLSATPATFTRLIRGVVPICMRHGISFKYLRSIETLGRANAGLFGYSQIGKNFVIYLDGITELSGALVELKLWLDTTHHYGPVVPRVRHIWPGRCAYIRYGAYRGDSLSYEGKEIPDDRNNPEAASSLFTFDVASSLSLGQDRLTPEHASTSLLAKYPVRYAICRSGKGGVFQAVDIDSGLEVIAKVGLRHGAELPDGRDGAFFVGNEALMYQRMRERGLEAHLPRVIAFAREDDAAILILEKLEGENLCASRRHLSSDPAWVRLAIDAIEAVHRNDFVLGDAKLTNFVASRSSLRIIDLESCQDLNAHQFEVMPASFRFVGVAGFDSFETDVIHFLVSILFMEDSQESLIANRTIDLAELVRKTVIRDSWDELAVEVLRRFLERAASSAAVAVPLHTFVSGDLAR